MSPTSARAPRLGVVAATLAVCAGIAGLLAPPAAAQEPPVAASPASITLEAGAPRVVEFRLSEPIIAGPGEPDPAFVTLALTPSSPGTVELSAPSVTWLASAWHEVRSVTVTALGDGEVLAGSLELAGAVTSNSTFYDGRVLSVAVDVVSVEPAPTTTVPAGPSMPAAPPTGAVDAPEQGRVAAGSPSGRSGAATTPLPTELALTGPPGAGALAVAGLLLVAVGAVLAGRRRADAAQSSDGK